MSTLKGDNMSMMCSQLASTAPKWPKKQLLESASEGLKEWISLGEL